MNAFPPDIHFKYPWRNYQERVLAELSAHLEDDHLHVIAPPGSGKTVLGLQVALALNKPTLVLAPTVAIRNQWIDRFCELFLQTNSLPDWISRDIRAPKFLTVATYQSLHAACSNTEAEEELLEEDEVEARQEKRKTKASARAAVAAKPCTPLLTVVDLLKAQGIGTIVVDEAHHLKNEWWKTLSEVKRQLQPTIVGLTATPPYDVTYSEWQRYIELNGPVDTEITVPELVVEGDLCPHQDYVYFSFPTTEESTQITHFRKRIARLYGEILHDQTLREALLAHPIYTNPKANLEWIYSNLSCYSATLIFLKATGTIIAKAHLEVIGDHKFSVPDLDYTWLEILLTFYLYKDPEGFKAFADHQVSLENKVKRNGALEKKQVQLSHSAKVNSLLSTSVGKLDSIQTIVAYEYGQLREGLRMVILTDYIRKEFLGSEPLNLTPISKVGVLPIFEQLRRSNAAGMKLGVLSGSLVLLSIHALPLLEQLAAQRGIASLATRPLPGDEGYAILQVSEQLKHEVVYLVTEVFQRGGIEVLIGTKSLLGEGWDAPCINALILASFVGSFVLSNQMRGRAIRREHHNAEKTGNIWHLVCLDPSSPTGGDDLELLSRRFKGFVGLSHDKDVGIENGVGRLSLPEVYSPEKIQAFNALTLQRAEKRNELKKQWHDALQNGVSLVEEIKIPFPEGKSYQSTKSLYFTRTIAYLLGELFFGFMIFLDVTGRVRWSKKAGQN